MDTKCCENSCCGETITYDADDQCAPVLCAVCRRDEDIWLAREARYEYLREIYLERLADRE